jgi:hypothetical protein
MIPILFNIYVPLPPPHSSKYIKKPTIRVFSMSNSNLCCKAGSRRMQSEEWRVED